MSGIESTTSVAVLGPGGVGSLVGALLAHEGVRVVCLARQATVDRLRAHGITVRSDRFGSFTVPVEAATRLHVRADAVLVTVKAPDLLAALDAVPPSALGDALVIPFLNGIEHVATLRGRYSAEAVVPATIRVEATRVAVGQVEHTSPFASVEFAASAANGDRVGQLAAHLRGAGLEVNVRTDETAMLWEKLAFLAPLAILTTYAEAPAGAVRTDCRDDLVACIREVTEVAKAKGAHVDVDRLIAAIDGVPASMRSSMQRDAAAGRPTELEAIGGAVVRAADRARVPVPVTRRLVEALRDRQPTVSP
ncbi:MAG: 2-dehydropantoate 2-reductase [Candidatus Dormibacteraeota bacterium]|uniref:2-dehydropantoate 2-reductase n=1 Tax=Candidatus Aeolococcus gillhamiae TaxID=3127015 RepID=A0A2W6AKT5_9BACT|nr:2-dehydropantoate 2-reductase [Candidatus Dormibacteraeota bacterium]PZR84234.1 MAG: 2-dehydropantoate 2-reductase [Candidatus Dormibacter sp. RRmetagenome_bin12]